MKYQFVQTVRVYETTHNAGSEIDEALIPVGSLENLLRMGQVRPIPEAKPVEAPSIAAPEPVLKQNSGKRR